MFDLKGNGRLNRRSLLAAAAMALVAGCTVVPKAPQPGPPPAPTPPPSQSELPVDKDRHSIALLVPMTGANAGVGQAIANAANMALLDTAAKNLRVTTYDTSANPAEAARRAVTDGNQLILGPLLADDIPAVSGIAKAAKVPVISFSNDEQAANRDVLIMGNLPGQSVTRTVQYARSQGISTFGALVPRGDYGDRTSAALLQAVRASGGSVIALEPYERSAVSIASAAQRVKAKGGFDALLIADSGSLSVRAATAFKGAAKTPGVKILGTELWSGERDVNASAALAGAWYSTVSDQRFAQFSKSYRARFGSQPFRIATLGYDAVLLTLRVARDWKPGTRFPVDTLRDTKAFPGGFLGVDGAFRFTKGGLIERALEVREVGAGTVKVVSPAPVKFGE
ncbi:penicillin-binding protein activator [Novosphingobium resinovorum]|uniref:ABC transporter substrate-binding protein n=1 Tax=Novosphingobium resinovorum TaxID=158500 RepID=A0A031K6X7_9SPHN|nr:MULTISPECIES: penicillin-binding protein activator [Novosphingobium]AOR75977.1 ABC transporter substrate-binding protein [Novosphingobium resinovorum]EZP84989.1 Extracellular ligand-binding receptor [Novosphingobium resinovorum]MBF7011356.1 penicillin-binding protein activator [Novosphingobium sp. HR1a]WJM29338.1 penicillin-binding protein activator [Novosphingobium resinovorum]